MNNEGPAVLPPGPFDEREEALMNSFDPDAIFARMVVFCALGSVTAGIATGSCIPAILSVVALIVLAQLTEEFKKKR